MYRFTEADAAQRSVRWRSVLGEYPTGIAIISALDGHGEPQGLVVGTFSSVSMDPPLVSYMPMRSSRSYTAIRDATHFRVSVLGSGHEELCRAFATAPPESRFAVGTWERDTRGLPHLADCVVWFDCKRAQTIEAGDHDIVLGEVEDLGFGNGGAGMPLLFLKGGYGSFTVPRLDFDPQHLGSHLRLADGVRDLVQELAEELGLAVTLGTVAKDSVVILSAANIQAPQSVVGVTFPFAAPMSPVFAAWGVPEREAAWRSAGKGIGFVQDELLDRMLARVRACGYAVSLGPAMAHRFERVVGATGWDPDEVARLWADITKEYATLGAASDWGPRDVCPGPHLRLTGDGGHVAGREQPAAGHAGRGAGGRRQPGTSSRRDDLPDAVTGGSAAGNTSLTGVPPAILRWPVAGRCG